MKAFSNPQFQGRLQGNRSARGNRTCHSPLYRYESNRCVPLSVEGCESWPLRLQNYLEVNRPGSARRISSFSVYHLAALQNCALEYRPSQFQLLCLPSNMSLSMLQGDYQYAGGRRKCWSWASPRPNSLSGKTPVRPGNFPGPRTGFCNFPVSVAQKAL